jgi:hypothetical protein
VLITACSALLHKMAVRAINRKILSSFHRSSYWWNYNVNSYEWSLPSLVVHIVWHVLLRCTKWLPELKTEYPVYGYHRSNCWPDFHQNSQDTSFLETYVFVTKTLLVKTCISFKEKSAEENLWKNKQNVEKVVVCFLYKITITVLFLRNK